jgi:hypothetical protein
MCSGARRDALLKAPSSRTRAGTLGLVLILIAIISSFTAGYAFKRAFLGDPYVLATAVIGGVIWGTLVFCIDRLMLLGMDKLDRPWLQFLVRVPLAVIISLVMSKPLVLKVSQSILDKELRKERIEAIQRETNANAAHLNEQRRDIQKIREARQQQEMQLDQEPDSFRYRNAKDALVTAEERFQRIQSVNGQRIAQARREILQIRSVQPIDPAQQSRITALTQQIARDQREIELNNTAVMAARNEELEASREWQQTAATRLKTTNEELERVRAQEAMTSPIVDAANEEAKLEITRLMIPNLVNEYSTLRRITSGDYPDSAALRTFEYSLDFLFLALELTPILMKLLSKKDPLDYATAAVEFLDQERINLEANAKAKRMQQATEAAAKIEEQAIEIWKDTQINDLQKKRLTTADLQKLREELVSAYV